MDLHDLLKAIHILSQSLVNVPAGSKASRLLEAKIEELVTKLSA